MLAALRSRAHSLSSPSLRQPWLWKLNQTSSLSSLTRDDYGRTEILKLDEIEKVLSEVRADDVKVLRVGDQCDLTDYMVFATGRSSWHVRNIAQALVYKAGNLFLPNFLFIWEIRVFVVVVVVELNHAACGVCNSSSKKGWMCVFELFLRWFLTCCCCMN